VNCDYRFDLFLFSSRRIQTWNDDDRAPRREHFFAALAKRFWARFISGVSFIFFTL